MTDAIHITANEETILIRLLESVGSTVSREDLMRDVTASSGSFDVMINRLRGKGFTIDTPRGKGVKGAYTLSLAHHAKARAAVVARGASSQE